MNFVERSLVALDPLAEIVALSICCASPGVEANDVFETQLSKPIAIENSFGFAPDRES